MPFPEDPERLEKLPGIGHYTARAIAAFAYNKPHAFIETNIRAVYIHFFFPDQGTVTDAELLPLIEETLDRKNPRAWYSALMDYGAKLKKEGKGKNARSAHYAKQKAFKGSDREVRGAILRMAVERKRLTLAQLVRGLPFPKERIASNVEKLAKEGLLRSERGIIRIR